MSCRLSVAVMLLLSLAACLQESQSSPELRAKMGEVMQKLCAATPEKRAEIEDKCDIMKKEVVSTL